MSSYMIRRASAEKISYLIPPRTFLEMCGKALGGALSLVTDQQHRDSYMKYIKEGIIRDDVFWQNGSNALGPVLVLGLFSELDDPSLKKYGFNAEEFLDGVLPALEQFHNTEKSLDNRIFKLLNQAEGDQTLEEEESIAKMSDDNAQDEKVNENADQTEEETLTKITDEKEKATEEVKAEGDDSFTKEERDVMSQFAEREAQFLAVLTQGAPSDTVKPSARPFWNTVLNWDWKDSLVGDLKPMVSNDFFKTLQKDKTIGCMLHKIKGVDLTYQEDSSSVENVALLSARVMVMDREDQVERETDFDTLVDDELNTQEEDDSRLSVAAQIEVLYDIRHSVSVSAKPPPGVTNEGNNGEFTERLVRVGILEGFLRGGKDGEVRWKLSNVREPWEIPPVDTEFDFRPN